MKTDRINFCQSNNIAMRNTLHIALLLIFSLQLAAQQGAPMFRGLCYGPHRVNQDPDFGIQPTREQIIQDLAFIKHLTPAIRTYGLVDDLTLIPLLCDSIGIDCYPGAWLAKSVCENEKQCDNIIQIANLNLPHVKGLVVGNEVLLRGDMSEAQLIAYIDKVKASTDLPIATAETWFDWMNSPNLANAVDVLFVHIYPYWDGLSVESGAAYILEKWNDLQAKYPFKTMVLGETGWPSKGEVRVNAVPGETNQKTYMADFLKMAEQNDIDYFYFEIFNESWKKKFEGVTGANWGIFLEDGAVKPWMADFIPQPALDNSISRLPGTTDTLKIDLPLYVYRDGCDPLNKFYSSGWMGELASIFNDTITSPTQIIDELWTDAPYSGQTCIRIHYKPSLNQWGGIYWQFHVNNWGNYPGYDFTEDLPPGAKVKLRFWAKGENGGERAIFKSGGMKNQPGDTLHPYSDSYGPVVLVPAIVVLTQAWKEYTIDLTGKNLSNVMGGFVWVTDHAQNPQGATIFLDEIAFDLDYDGDGYYALEDDCNDHAASVYPGAPEIGGNGIDEDCNGQDLTKVAVQLEDEGITVHPNPYGDYLFISSADNKPVRVKITDQYGRQLYSSVLLPADQGNKISLERLPAGMHWVEVREAMAGERLYAKKLLKL